MDPFDIKPYHGGRTPFSPRIDIDEYDLKISVPAQIVFKPGSKSKYDASFAYIPVSLAYRVPADFSCRMASHSETILYIATDVQRGATYVGNGMPELIMLRPPPGDEPPDFGPGPSAKSHGGWATINLAKQAELPAREATYWVHAVFGPYVSNVVRVEVYERRGGAR